MNEAPWLVGGTDLGYHALDSINISYVTIVLF